jgi:hypothetical protein
LKGGTPLAEPFGRFQEHLAHNNVDLAKTPAILGAPLSFDPKSETIHRREPRRRQPIPQAQGVSRPVDRARARVT